METRIARIWAFTLFATTVSVNASGQVFPVEYADKGASSPSVPTMTFLYPAANARATLVFIPGGPGHVGVQAHWDASHGYFARYHFNRMLRTLSEPDLVAGGINVVIFDNPVPIPGNGPRGWPAGRAGTEHLRRIEGVVGHYREKLGVPVWVMGHSNGGISVTELLKHLQGSASSAMIAGLVYSAGRDGASFDGDTTLPVLLLHHEMDACPNTTPQHTLRTFNKLRERGNKVAEFVSIKGGEAEPKDPCVSGFHMYFGSGDEVPKAIDRYVAKHTAPR